MDLQLSHHRKRKRSVAQLDEHASMGNPSISFQQSQTALIPMMPPQHLLPHGMSSPNNMSQQQVAQSTQTWSGGVSAASHLQLPRLPSAPYQQMYSNPQHYTMPASYPFDYNLQQLATATLPEQRGAAAASTLTTINDASQLS